MIMKLLTGTSSIIHYEWWLVFLDESCLRSKYSLPRKYSTLNFFVDETFLINEKDNHTWVQM